MSEFKKESHLRSLLKGLSWRVVATLDTVVVVLLVTWWNGKPNLNHALAIGASEFLIKYVVYYLHERIWEQLRSGTGLDQARTLKKAISWRIVATCMTFIIAGAVLNEFNSVALAIACIEFVTKFALYYAHERVWLMLPLGQLRQWLRRQLGR